MKPAGKAPVEASTAQETDKRSDLHALQWDGEETLLTVKEAADALGVHPQTLRTWIRTGYMPCLRVGPSGANLRILPEVVRRLGKARKAQRIG